MVPAHLCLTADPALPFSPSFGKCADAHMKCLVQLNRLMMPREFPGQAFRSCADGHTEIQISGLQIDIIFV